MNASSCFGLWLSQSSMPFENSKAVDRTSSCASTYSSQKSIDSIMAVLFLLLLSDMWMLLLPLGVVASASAAG